MAVEQVAPVVPTPKLPTTWEKSIPILVILLGGMLGSAGTFYSTEVATDPETKEVVGTKVDIGAILSAIAGAAVTIGGVFKAASNTNRAEAAATHATAAATTAVAIAAGAPPVGADGEMTVENTLISALVQAGQTKRLKDAAKILATLGALEEGGAK